MDVTVLHSPAYNEEQKYRILALMDSGAGRGVQGERMLPNFYTGEQPIHFALPPIFTLWVSQCSSELFKTCKLSVIVSLHYNRWAINSDVSLITSRARTDNLSNIAWLCNSLYYADSKRSSRVQWLGNVLQTQRSCMSTKTLQLQLTIKSSCSISLAEILTVLVYLANSDDCILAALYVRHYLRMFYVTCMLKYSTAPMLPKLYTTYTDVYISPLSVSYRKDIHVYLFWSAPAPQYKNSSRATAFRA